MPYSPSSRRARGRGCPRCPRRRRLGRPRPAGQPGWAFVACLPFGCWPGGSVRGGLVIDHGQAGYLAVADAEVTGHDQIVGQVGLVVGAVVAGTDDDVAVVVDDLADVHRDVVADELLGHEGTDRTGAPDLAAVVVDVGAGCEGGDDPVGVEGVHGRDVLSDDGGQLGAHGQVLPVGSRRPPWPARPTLAAALTEGSTRIPGLDSPLVGGSRLGRCLPR